MLLFAIVCHWLKVMRLFVASRPYILQLCLSFFFYLWYTSLCMKKSKIAATPNLAADCRPHVSCWLLGQATPSAFQVLWSLLSSKFRSALLHCRSLLFLVSLTVSIYYPNSHLLPHSRSCGRVVFARWWLALPCMLHQCVCLSIHASPTKLASGSKSGHACLQAELPVS